MNELFSNIKNPILIDDTIYKESSINKFCQVQKINSSSENFIINGVMHKLIDHHLCVNISYHQQSTTQSIYTSGLFNSLFNSVINELEKDFLDFLDKNSIIKNISFYKENLFRNAINFFIRNARYSFKSKKNNFVNNNLSFIISKLFVENFDFVTDEYAYIIISPQIAQFVARLNEFEITKNLEGPSIQFKCFGLLYVQNTSIQVYLNYNESDQNSLYFGIKKRKGIPQLVYNNITQYEQSNYDNPCNIHGNTYRFNFFYKFINADSNSKYNKVILNV